MSTDSFFKNIVLEEVGLRVHSLPEEVAFYTGVLGLKVVSEENGQTKLSVDGKLPALLVLNERASAKPLSARTAGLFHVALLYPNREALATVLARLASSRYAIQGAAFHGVSEAIYLADPEGNGIELYFDLPSDTWLRANESVEMVTEPLDLAELLSHEKLGSSPYTAPAALRVGHIHLRGASLAHAKTFYDELLGFPVRQKDYPGALFFGRDGYHHHLAVNTWQSDRPADPQTLGLESFAIRLADTDEFDRIVAGLKNRDLVINATADQVEAKDFDGIVCKLIRGAAGVT